MHYNISSMCALYISAKLLVEEKESVQGTTKV